MNFLNELQEHICMFKPQILVLLETYITKQRTKDICKKIGYEC